MRPWITIFVCAAAMAVATSAQAQITADVARQCRAMMLKAHPTMMYGRTGSAAAQRDYYQDCIKRQGKMDDGRSDPAKSPDKRPPFSRADFKPPARVDAPQSAPPQRLPLPAIPP